MHSKGDHWQEGETTYWMGEDTCKWYDRSGVSHLPTEWLLSKRTQMRNVGKDVKKGNPLTLLMGMCIGAATVENSIEVSQKAKNRTTL